MTQLRRTGETYWLTGFWSLCALMFLLPAVGGESESPLASLLIGSVSGAASFVLAVRTFRCEVRLDQDDLLVRTMFRTRRFPWSEVVEARVEPANPTGILALVALDLRSGRRIRVDGIANWAVGRDVSTLPVTRITAAINERIAAD